MTQIEDYRSLLREHEAAKKEIRRKSREEHDLSHRVSEVHEEKKVLLRKGRYLGYHLGKFKASMCGLSVERMIEIRLGVKRKRYYCKWKDADRNLTSRYGLHAWTCTYCKFDPSGDVDGFKAKVLAAVLGR